MAAKVDRTVILVADDDREVRQIVIEYLTLAGFRTFLEARDGTEAYVILNDPFRRIDLVISDWEMPRTTGLTLLQALRKHRIRKDIPFIMITSQQSQERLKISQAKASHVNFYIVKPFRAQTLLDKVSEALGVGPLSVEPREDSEEESSDSSDTSSSSSSSSSDDDGDRESR